MFLPFHVASFTQHLRAALARYAGTCGPCVEYQGEGAKGEGAKGEAGDRAHVTKLSLLQNLPVFVFAFNFCFFVGLDSLI